MDSDKQAKTIMHPHLEAQSQQADRIRHRTTLQSKFLLVLATAFFSGFATYTVHRYLVLDKFSVMSIPVLLILAIGLLHRWRAS